MSKPTLFVVTLVFLAVLAAIVGWLFFGSGNNSLSPKTVQPINTSIQKAQSSVITDCTPPEVNNARLAFFNEATNVYGLRGKILSIIDAISGKRLITDIKGKIPSFTIVSSTKILLVKDEEESVGSSGDAQVGQKVVISIHCSANKVWVTSTVRILPNAVAIPKSSPLL